MSTENKPSAAAMRAAEKIQAWAESTNRLDETRDQAIAEQARIIDAELASESLEQRATAAADEAAGELWGDGYLQDPEGENSPRTIEGLKRDAAKYVREAILRHFAGVGGGNEKLRKAAVNLRCFVGLSELQEPSHKGACGPESCCDAICSDNAWSSERNAAIRLLDKDLAQSTADNSRKENV